MSEKFYWSPFYQSVRDDWIRHRDIYDAKKSIVCAQPYLYAHEQESKGTKESSELYVARAARSHFVAITRMIVSLYQSLFFRCPIEYDPATEELLGDAKKNIDGHGMTLQSMMCDHVLVHDLLYGYAWVLVDAFGTQVRSKGDEEAAGIRPFMNPIDPLSVPDWQVETADAKRIGKLNAWRRQYQLEKPRVNLREQAVLETRTDEYLIVPGGFNINRFKTDASARDLQTKKIDEIAWESVNESAGVQVVALPEITVASLMSEPWVRDVTDENIRHFNLRSSCDNIEYYQAYQKIIVSGEGVNDASIIEGMTENSIALISRANVKVDFVPPGDSAALKQSINESVDMCFKIGLDQIRNMPASSKAGQSAESRQEEKDPTIAAVESEIGNIQTLLNEALGYYAQYKGVENYIPGATLETEIDDTDWNTFRSNYLATRDIMKGVAGWDAAVAQKIIRGTKLPQKQKEALLKEAEALKNLVEEQGADAVQAALNGK